MIRIYLLSICLSISFICYSSNYKLYKYCISDNIECDLFLFNNGKYYIQLNNQITLDINEGLLLSYGDFIKEENTIKLKDTPIGYTLKFSIKNNELIGFKTYFFLLNKSLVFTHKGFMKLPPFFIYNNNKPIASSDNLAKSNFKIGNYINKFGLNVHVYSNNNFGVYYHSIKIFSGYYNYYKDNIVYLEDVSINHKFKMLLLNDKSMKGFLVPGKDNRYYLSTNFEFDFFSL